MIIPYASRTGTRRNLAALRECGWRLMVSAQGVLRDEGFVFSIDNGAWHSFQQGKDFDENAFGRALAWAAGRQVWTVCPDIVCGGLSSLAYSLSWIDRTLAASPNGVLLSVQNGMEPEHVERYLGPSVGIFVGGDTEWKIASLPTWCKLAKERGCICHVGRVNDKRRIGWAVICGATSFDGSGPSRYEREVWRLDAARRERFVDDKRRQVVLPLEE